MPVIWRKHTGNFSIVIWNSTERLSDLFLTAGLNEVEKYQLSTFKSETRQREWLTVRNALQTIDANYRSGISYDANGKPHLLNGNCISISHSHNHIAVMTARAKRIGVDIEIIHPRIEKLAQKFLSAEEKAHAQQRSLEKLHVFWGAKEVLYKLHSLGDIDFKKDLHVQPFELNSMPFKATLTKKGFEADFDIYYEKVGEYMVTWSVDN